MICDENEKVAWDANPAAGTRKTLEINGVEFPFRYCPPGTFLMGAPEYDEAGVREVTLTRGFWTLETPVTQRLYEAITGENPSEFSTSGQFADDVAGLDTSDFPVENVSWFDCQDYCEALNALNVAPTGFAFRLPWEAEWEYACRAGTTTPFFWGTTLNGDRANCNGNEPYGDVEPGPCLERPSAVGSYGANPWGLLDMSGNVWEWAADWWGKYDATPQTDPTGPSEPTPGWGRIVRGGSWDDEADLCLSGSRLGEFPEDVNYIYGFRIVLARKV